MSARRHRFGAAWYAAPAVVFLAVFFLYPVLRLLLLSVQIEATGELTTEHFHRALTAEVYVRVLGITFGVAGETTLGAVVLGYPLAYWLARQPLSRRGWLLMLVLIPFWTSYLVKTFAWMITLDQSGIMNRALVGAGIVPSPIDVLHGRMGVRIGMIHAMLPLAVLTMLPVMLSVERQLPRAAATLGAPPGQIFWRVFFHLSLPGVAAAGLLVFITSLGFFITPALLGGPRETMLAQLIIAQVQEMMNWSFAGALAVMMLLAALVTCWVYDRLFGLSTVAGEATASDRRGTLLLRGVGIGLLSAVAAVHAAIGGAMARVLGRRVLCTFLPAYVVLVLLFLCAPTLIVVPMGFTDSSFLSFPPPGFSLRWFETYFGSPLWLGATLRSFVVGFGTACLATLLGGFAALALARSSGRWQAALFGLLIAPMIVPRIVIALGLFYLFAQLGLVATELGMILGHAVLAMPFVFITVAAVLKGYDWRLDQAAATLGASRLRVLVEITVPLLKGGLIAAFLFAFITSFDDLTVALFVSGGVTVTLPKQMWDDMILQLNPTLAAVSTVVFVLVTTLLVLAEWMRRRGEVR
ncbi:ABC transporter permease subunit [Elioraea sp.]|uniref:ABC transporter permease subunit n=1 Tax=Elioraea sp. TaxID=2185103 RepID=UPI0025BC8703|nr:ABC transporter permease subunit [Elioraea sp.]